MGRGDKRTRRGKISSGSHGKVRKPGKKKIVAPKEKAEIQSSEAE